MLSAAALRLAFRVWLNSQGWATGCTYVMPVPAAEARYWPPKSKLTAATAGASIDLKLESLRKSQSLMVLSSAAEAM